MGFFGEMDLDRTIGDADEDARLDRADGLLFGEPISTYTRAEALADGVLLDVSELAREAGFTSPVAITAALSADIDAIPAHLVGIASRAGRLWDVLWMASIAVRRTPGGGDRLVYRLVMPTPHAPPIVGVKLICGPGDAAEPVITLMRPDES